MEENNNLGGRCMFCGDPIAPTTVGVCEKPKCQRQLEERTQEAVARTLSRELFPDGDVAARIAYEQNLREILERGVG